MRITSAGVLAIAANALVKNSRASAVSRGDFRDQLGLDALPERPAGESASSAAFSDTVPGSNPLSTSAQRQLQDKRPASLAVLLKQAVFGLAQ